MLEEKKIYEMTNQEREFIKELDRYKVTYRNNMALELLRNEIPIKAVADVMWIDEKYVEEVLFRKIELENVRNSVTAERMARYKGYGTW